MMEYALRDHGCRYATTMTAALSPFRAHQRASPGPFAAQESQARTAAGAPPRSLQRT